MNKFIKCLIAANLAATMLFAATGCVGNIGVQAAASIQPVQTAVPTATPTASQMATPTPSATEAALTPEQILDQNVKSFLNKDSSFSRIGGEQGIKGEVKLGIISPIDVEGLLLGHVEKDGYTLLIMGFEDNNSNRFVTPVAIPNHVFNDSISVPMKISKIEGPAFNTNVVSSFSSKSRDEVSDFLSEIENKPIVMQLVFNNITGDYGNDPAIIDSIRDINSRVTYAKVLMKTVAGNGIDIGNLKVSSDLKLNMIENESDILKIDVARVPTISPGFHYCF